MTRAILDTNLLIADQIPRVDDELAISVVSLAELHHGALVVAEADERALRLGRLAAVEHCFTPLPVDEAVARNYGRVASTVRAGARNPLARGFDLMIAATALAHSARLYTRNVDDFAGLEDLVDVRRL